MIQTIVLVLLLIAGAVVAQANAPALHAPVSLRIPGFPDVGLSNLRVLAGLGGAALLVWIAGMLDVAALSNQIRRRDALLRTRDEDIKRIKSEAYDRERPVLGDIRTQLGEVAIQVKAVVGRLDTAARARVAEIRTADQDRSPLERVPAIE